MGFSFRMLGPSLCLLFFPLSISALNLFESSVRCASNDTACNDTTECSFLYEGKSQTHLMFTEPGVNITFSINEVSNVSECQVRILAVGGGGYAFHDDMFGDGGGGGGSGYIKYYTQTISGNKTEISVIVGDHDEASTININTGDGDTLAAQAGHSGNEEQGGDGYSGGGDVGHENGGSNGSNGQGAIGGSGTGEDISSYTFQNFQLSPGSGGEYHRDFFGHFYGAGGGGILVDGAGPGKKNRGGLLWSHGQGYGGGGNYGDQSDYFGHSGVIILEII